ncbi:MAG: hypothetical protein EPN56_07810, partial [Rhodanobacter sp.]
MRQVVLDTETTGLEVRQGHRLVEIACVEVLERRVTGKYWQTYLNPERAMDEGASQVTGWCMHRPMTSVSTSCLTRRRSNRPHSPHAWARPVTRPGSSV